MQPTFISRTTYIALFLLLGVVYIVGLFVPLMDNDSAHHAAIALRMYQTGDYVNLVDLGHDYLDKPHLHFWLSALSYHIFGVTSFAYKFPSFLFTIMGTYATFRLGKSLYDAQVGRLAALITASAFAYILANNDVRMDAILTASIILATWQLVDWINTKRWIHVFGAALGLALGFATKGHIAVFTPGVAALFYILYKKEWKLIFSLQFLTLIISFFIFIAPVVYCYYLQFDLHPEKVIRGESGRSGVAFILWQQNFERFQGDSWGGDGKNDRFFFLHSFLWAFAPWSIIAFTAFFSRIKSFKTRRWEWLTIGTFAVLGLMISFSGFKLPHYLNILFPIAAVLTSAYLHHHISNQTVINRLFVVQAVLSILLLLAAGVINVWAFPIHNIMAIAGFIILLAASFYLIKKTATKQQRLIVIPVTAIALCFYLLNSNFYPQLLTYQGGNELARDTRSKVNPKHVYFWPGTYSTSYNFYSGQLHQYFSDTVYQQKDTVWVMAGDTDILKMKAAGYPILGGYAHRDYQITRLKGTFINPARREEVLGKMVLVRIK